MSNRVLIPLTLAFTLVVSLGSAQAGSMPGGPTVANDPFILQFDENGNGRSNDNGLGFVNNPGFMQVDPTTGIKALTYALPENVFGGEVLIKNFAGTAISDAINFYDIGNTSYMAYYSLAGGGSLADTGVPLLTSFVGGQEDAKGNFDYFVGNDYQGNSPPLSQTPEPASLTLAGLNILGVLAVRYRLRRRSA